MVCEPNLTLLFHCLLSTQTEELKTGKGLICTSTHCYVVYHSFSVIVLGMFTSFPVVIVIIRHDWAGLVSVSLQQHNIPSWAHIYCASHSYQWRVLSSQFFLMWQGWAGMVSVSCSNYSVMYCASHSYQWWVLSMNEQWTVHQYCRPSFWCGRVQLEWYRFHCRYIIFSHEYNLSRLPMKGVVIVLSQFFMWSEVSQET